MSENENEHPTKAAVARSEKTSERTASGPTVAQDETRAPEEENESQLDGDPRLPSEMQPPTSEAY